jgi:hypothetical protein
VLTIGGQQMCFAGRVAGLSVDSRSRKARDGLGIDAAQLRWSGVHEAPEIAGVGLDRGRRCMAATQRSQILIDSCSRIGPRYQITDMKRPVVKRRQLRSSAGLDAGMIVG